MATDSPGRIRFSSLNREEITYIIYSNYITFIGKQDEFTLGWANFSKSSQIEPLFSYSMCMGKIRSHTFDLAPFIGIKNALQNGITIGFLDFRKYVKRLDGN